ncbi:protein-disulfide reductase DsbD [Sulfuricurvum sp.]|uniref:protein-disulfide reductase DsbD n=1 Tax=Sulfuricurvum sp. TaxID=2025608 RepID=UPI002606D3E6|nr:protein-disulfide reductase DsbD [Sulfuricurvum sp.]MDD2266244.1 protein-disulfide reductase DsbD [Sulfuricurvum sp.]MDD2783657.1 protein-disulfide reductase DsbD [Sulfuricurvum sp.]HZF69527.1 protein-disulfide reductase DsbD [Sulfuricurvum sp.]
MRWLLFLLISFNVFGVGFLQPDEAFKPSAKMVDGKTIGVELIMGDQIHIYSDKLKVEDADKNDGIDFKAITMAKPIQLDGESVYESSPAIRIALEKTKELSGEKKVKVKISYQGCSSAGLCYEPIEKTLDVTLNADTVPMKESLAAPVKKASVTEAKAVEAAPIPQAQAKSVAKESETDQIAGVIKGGSLWFIILSFFGFGLLLALTPCVFPMIPIISSVIMAQGAGLGTKRAFWLSVVYVLSMAVAYTIAGILAGLFGANLQAAFQTPWIITLFSLIFVVLAMSMFDLFELQIPNVIQSKITKISGSQSGVVGIAIMGFLSALIVGPCVAAPLAGALIYIGQTGDALLGGIALFSLSIGMGVPLIAIGTSAGKFMPKPGVWMDNIKSIFGVMLIGISIWMISRILDENISMMLWGALAVFVAVNMGALEQIRGRCIRCQRANKKALGIIIFLYGMSLLLGGMAGATNPLHPLNPFLPNQVSASVNQPQHKSFEKITSLQELDAILAQNKGKKVMVDFYADWCTACKEYESKTFSDESVKTAMDQYVLVQVNLTANDDKAKEISSKFGIFGPPAILFFDENGVHQKDADIVGFKEPQEFIKHLGQ